MKAPKDARLLRRSSYTGLMFLEKNPFNRFSFGKLGWNNSKDTTSARTSI